MATMPVTSALTTRGDDCAVVKSARALVREFEEPSAPARKDECPGREIKMGVVREEASGASEE